jgi:two-component system cell cycle sensor histidine kinase/response regulator CckA
MRKQPDAARANGERYEKWFHHIGFGVLVADASGTIQVANRAALALLHMTEQDLIGRRFEIDTIGEDGAPLRPDHHPIAQAISRRAPVRDVALGIRRPGEAHRTWLFAYAQPVFGSEGEISEVVFTVANVTGIRERAERLRELIESLDQTAILMNADANETLYASPNYERIWGRSLKDLYANPRAWIEFIHPEDRPHVEAAMDRLIKGEPISVDHRIIMPDGSVRWMQHGGYPVRDAEGRVQRLLGSSRDITQRKLAEKARRETEERLRALATQAPAILWTTDKQLRFTSGMGAGLAKVGMSENQLNGTLVNDLFEPELPDHPAIQAHRRALNGELVAFVENWRGRTYDVQVQPLHDQCGKISGVVGVGLDVTEREHAQRLAIEWKNRYEAAVQASGHVLYDWDARTGEVHYAGDSRKALGYSIEELAGGLARWIELIHPEDRAGFEQEVERSKREKDLFHQEYRLRSGTGGYLNIQDDGKLIFDSAGNLERIIGFIANVTERKRLEEQLRQAQKMEAIGRLAGGIAHDFNNLLQVILGYSETLREQLEGSEPALASLMEIESAARRSEALVSQLLAFSRRQMLQPSVLDLNEIVRGAERLLRPLLGEDIELQTRLDPNLGRVAADAGQMSQVIINLAVNARDAMPDGGTLTIATENAGIERPQVRPEGTVPPGEYALLSVSDTGVGMDPETRARIFEPFFTTKGTGQGTGLGLSMVQGIVAQSGGSILVESELGHGSTFRIYLPRTTAEPGAREVTARVEVSRGKETILIAEDEDAVRKLVKRMLERAGYTVLPAASGNEALHLLEQHGETIDLIITDVVMPGMSGPALAERARQMHGAVKVLYVSGYTDESIRGAAIPREAEFLAKPFSAEKVLHAVRRVLEQAA